MHDQHKTIPHSPHQTNMSARYLSFRARSLSPPARPQLVVVPPKEAGGKEGGGKETGGKPATTTSPPERNNYAMVSSGGSGGGEGEREGEVNEQDTRASQEPVQPSQPQQPLPPSSSTTTHLPQIIRGRALVRHQAAPDGAVFPHTLYSEIVDLSVSARGQGKACIVRAWNHKRALRSTKPSLNRLQALEKSTENNRKLPVCRVIEGDLQETAAAVRTALPAHIDSLYTPLFAQLSLEEINQKTNPHILTTKQNPRDFSPVHSRSQQLPPSQYDLIIHSTTVPRIQTSSTMNSGQTTATALGGKRVLNDVEKFQMSRHTDSGGGVGSIEGIDEIVHYALAAAVAAAEGNNGSGGGGMNHQSVHPSQGSSMVLGQGLGEASDVMGERNGGGASMGGFASNGQSPYRSYLTAPGGEVPSVAPIAPDGSQEPFNYQDFVASMSGVLRERTNTGVSTANMGEEQGSGLAPGPGLGPQESTDHQTGEIPSHGGQGISTGGGMHTRYHMDPAGGGSTTTMTDNAPGMTKLPSFFSSFRGQGQGSHRHSVSYDPSMNDPRDHYRGGTHVPSHRRISHQPHPGNYASERGSAPSYRYYQPHYHDGEEYHDEEGDEQDDDEYEPRPLSTENIPDVDFSNRGFDYSISIEHDALNVPYLALVHAQARPLPKQLSSLTPSRILALSMFTENPYHQDQGIHDDDINSPHYGHQELNNHHNHSNNTLQGSFNPPGPNHIDGNNQKIVMSPGHRAITATGSLLELAEDALSLDDSSVESLHQGSGLVTEFGPGMAPGLGSGLGQGSVGSFKYPDDGLDHGGGGSGSGGGMEEQLSVGGGSRTSRNSMAERLPALNKNNDDDRSPEHSGREPEPSLALPHPSSRPSSRPSSQPSSSPPSRLVLSRQSSQPRPMMTDDITFFSPDSKDHQPTMVLPGTGMGTGVGDHSSLGGTFDDVGDRLGEGSTPHDPQFFEERGGHIDKMGEEDGTRVGTGGGMKIGSRGGSAGHNLGQGLGPGHGPGGSSKNPSRIHTAGTYHSSKNSSSQSHRPTSEMYGYGTRSHYSLEQQIEDAHQVRICKQLQLAARVAYQRRQFNGSVGGGSDRIRGSSPPKHPAPLIHASSYTPSLALDESNLQADLAMLAKARATHANKGLGGSLYVEGTRSPSKKIINAVDAPQAPWAGHAVARSFDNTHLPGSYISAPLVSVPNAILEQQQHQQQPPPPQQQPPPHVSFNMGGMGSSGVNGGPSLNSVLLPGITLEGSIASISDQNTTDALAYAALANANAHINHPHTIHHTQSDTNLYPHTNIHTNAQHRTKQHDQNPLIDPSSYQSNISLLKGSRKKSTGENSMKWKSWRDEKILRDLQLSRYDPIRDCGKPLDDILDLTFDGANKISMTTHDMDRKREDVEGFLNSLPSNIRRQQQHGIVGKQKRNLVGKLLLPMHSSLSSNDLNIMTPLEDRIGLTGPMLASLTLDPVGKIMRPSATITNAMTISERKKMEKNKAILAVAK